MPPRPGGKASTLPQFLAAEAQRQRSCGCAVPESGEPLEVWNAEATARWAAAHPTLAKKAERTIAPALRTARNQLPDDAAGAALLAQLDAVSVEELRQLPSVPRYATGAPTVQADEIRATLEAFELTMRLYFADPNATHSPLEKILLRIKSSIRTLRAEGILSHPDGSYPELSLVYELCCYRRLLAHWSELTPELHKTANDSALELCNLFDSDEHRELATAIRSPTFAPATVMLLLGQATRATRFSFPQLFANVKAAFPSSQPPKIALKALRPATPPPQPQQPPPPAAPPQPSSSSSSSTISTPNGSSGNKGDSDAVSGVESAIDLTATALTRLRAANVPLAAMIAEDMAAKRARLESQQQQPNGGPTLASVLHPRPALLITNRPNPVRHLLGPGTSSAASGTSSGTFSIRPPPSTGSKAPVQAPAQPAQAAQAAPAGGGRFPCRSKYHAKYSSAEKHASPECSFCSTCHLLEFIFNGCGRDCSWKHYPTARKIAFNLKRFPAIYHQAMKRFDSMQCGEKLQPLEIPLQ